MTSASSSAKPPEATPTTGTANTAPPADVAPPPSNGHREAIAGLPFRQLPAPTVDWLRHGNTPGESQPVVLVHQTALLQINAHSRSRLNALYMTSIFIGGAFGSAIASSVYEHGGWLGVMLVGSAFALVALLRFWTVSRKASSAALHAP